MFNRRSYPRSADLDEQHDNVVVPWLIAGSMAVVVLVGGLVALLTVAAGGSGSCVDEPNQVETVRGLISQGQYDLAAATADLALNDNAQAWCSTTKMSLGSFRYSAGMASIFSAANSRTYDPAAQGHAVIKWRQTEQDASDVGVPNEQRVAAITIANQAATAGLWQLARAAFLDPWNAGAISHGDLNSVSFYYSVLRNWGVVLSQQTDEIEKQQGEALLRTAVEIATAYQLPENPALADLTRLMGGDQGKWPPPDASDAVLAARLSGQRTTTTSGNDPVGSVVTPTPMATPSQPKSLPATGGNPGR